MDILLQVGVFLVIFGLGKLVVTRSMRAKLKKAQDDRDKALDRLRELHK